MHQRDAIGDRIHLIFACLGLVCLFGPVTLTEIGFGPLAVFFVVRVINTFPVWIHGFGQPIVLAAIALCSWMMLSLLWSGNPALGWGEISELRWFVLVGLLFPVIEHRTKLIAAMCVGIAIGQLAQVADAFDGFGIEPIAKHVENHQWRIAGWWHPVVGGTLLVGALGLHLPAALFGIGRSRVFGVLGSGAVVIGIVATGTRGAWIAAALLVVFAVLFVAFTKRIRRRSVLVSGAIAALIVLIAGVVMRDAIQTRFDETRTELNEIANGQLDSYTGLRVQMAKAAFDAGVAHPLIGVGAGGFQNWAIEQNPDSAVHAHAHNSVLQVWSTLGVIGLGLWVLIFIIMIRSGWRIWDRKSEGVYGLAPMFAIIGLLLASLTDSIEINTQSAAMLAALAALSPSYCPKHPKWASDQATDK
ncbi:MAG: O-antigen ligase family protein [Phycisphaerales bacterium]|nr:O-antigen ligase family protein [Phycisphaerales bacterium]